MPIEYSRCAPHRASLRLCRWRLQAAGNGQAPPAVVISPWLPHRDGLCAVVPLSGSKPEKLVGCVVRLEFEHPLPDPFPQRIW